MRKISLNLATLTGKVNPPEKIIVYSRRKCIDIAIAVTILLIGFLSQQSMAQTTLYSQNFGSGSTFPAGWSNTGSSGWTISNATNSTGYTGASGSSNALITDQSPSGTKTLTFDNSLSTVGYNSITVIWGGRRNSTSSPTVGFQWSIDGTNWNTATFSDVGTSGNWALINGGTAIALPAGAAGQTNLRLRWSASISGNTNSVSYRFDDLLVQGIAAPTITSLGATSGCVGTSITINGTNLTGATAANVKIGGTAVSSITSNSGTQIVAVIGSGTTGTVSVTTGGGTATFGTSFTVNPLPAAPAGTPAARCGTGTVTISATPGGGETIDWYSLGSSGTLLSSANTSFTTPSISTNTTYYAQSRNTTTGCVSSVRTSVIASVNSVPSAPTGTNNARCGTGTVTISASASAGQTIDWYAASSLGTALLSGSTSFTTPSISTTTIYYAETRTTSTGCLSATRTAVTATVNNPVAPTANDPQTFCAFANPTVANLTVLTGSAVKWYSASTLGTALPTATALTDATHYFASQTITGCEGTARLDVTVALTNPAAPSGSSPQSFCAINNPTVANLVATVPAGSTIKWYLNATGGSALATTTVLTNGTHYYASQVNSGGCEGLTRLDVTATINNPAAPTGTAGQTFCAINNPTVADLSATATGSVQWYAASSGGTALATTTPLVNGTHYYASQTIAGCEGISRFDVTATVSNPAAPTGTATESFCADANPTVAVLTATGAGLQWYAASTGGSPLATATVLTTNTHYFASQTITGCEGLSRLDVTALVYVPVTITGQPDLTQTVCASLPASFSVTASGDVLSYQWYLGSTPLNDNSNIDGSHTATLSVHQAFPADAGLYHVVVTGNAPCGSVTSNDEELQVNQSIVINTPPAAQTLCAASTATFNVAATGSDLVYQWKKGGSPLTDGGNISGATTASLSIANISATDAGNYSVSISDGSAGCPNINSVNALLTVNATSVGGTLSSSAAVCSGINGATLTLSGYTGNIVKWETSTDGGAGWSDIANTSATQSYLNLTQTTIYRAIVISGVCPGEASTEATITVNPLPTITPDAAAAPVCFSASAQTTTLGYSATTNAPTNYSIVWNASPANSFAAVTNAVFPASPISITIPANTAPGTYTGTITVKNADGCISITGTSFIITVNPLPTITPSASATAVCFSSNAQSTPLTYGAPTNAPTSYSITWNSSPANSFVTVTDAALTASPVSIAIPAGTAPGTYTGTIRVKNANGCVSSTGTNFTVTVNPLPSIIPAASATDVCFKTTSQSSSLTYSGAANSPTTYSIVWTASPANSFAAVTNASLPASPISIAVPANTAAGTYTGTITVKNANGCVSSTGTDFTITVNPLPSIIPAAAASAVCFSTTAQSTSLTYSSTTNSPTTYSISWNGSPANSFAAVNNATLPAGQITITVPANTAAGTYTGNITVKNANGCAASASVPFTVTVNSLPSITPASTTAAVCFNASAQTTTLTYSAPANSPTTYSITWSGSPANSFVAVTDAVLSGSPITINIPANTAAAAYTGTIMVKNANGCGSSTGTNFTVKVNPLPTITPAATASSICFNTVSQSSSLTYTSTNTPTTYSIVWSASPANGFVNVTDAAITSPINISVPANTPAGTYTGTVTVKNANGCISSTGANFTITVNALPAIVTISGGGNFCNGSTVITADNGGDGTIYFQNTTSNGTSTTTASGTATVGSSGTYYFRARSAAGCWGPQGSVTVTELASFSSGTLSSGDQTICNGDDPANITFSSNPSGGAGTFNYQWYYQDGIPGTCPSGTSTSGWILIPGATGNSYDPPAGLLASRTYAVQVDPTGTPDCGGPTWASVCRKVTVRAAVNFGTVASGDQTLCSGGNPNSIAFSTAPSGGSGSFSYQWYYQDALAVCPSGTSTTGWTSIFGATSNTYDPPSGITTSRTYAVQVNPTGTPDCGVATWAASCRQITVNPLPTITTAASAPAVCFSTTAQTTQLTYSATTNAPITYSITWSGTFATVTNATLPASPISIAVPANAPAGTYTGTITVKNANGCTSNGTTFTVTVNALPTITTDAAAADVCSIPSVQTTPLAYSASTGTPTAYSITWNTAPANSFVAVTDASLPASPINISVPANTAAGTYTGTILVKNANGCVSNAKTFTVTVKAAPTGTLTAAETSGVANDNSICIGSSVTFTASTGFGSYIFKVNGTQVQAGTSNIWNSSSLANGASVTVDVANALNCGATFGPVVIIVNPLPVATLIADRTTICAGDAVTFTAGGGTSYSFKVNGSAVQISTSGTYQTNQLNNGDVVTVEATNANSCKAVSSPQTITVNALPVGTLGASATEICSGGSVTFTATSGFNAYEFFVNGVSAQAGTSRIYTAAFTNPSVVTVRATNTSTGCSKFWDTLAVNVNALPSGILTATENSGIADDNSICAGTAVNFTATPGFSTYNFMINGVSKQNSAANTYSNLTLANNDIVTVKVSSGSGCEATFAGVQITVVASPTGTLSVSPSATICAGDDVTFTATAGFTNYTFKVGTDIRQNGPSNTFNTTALINGDVVTVEVSNSNTCVTVFGPVAISVHPLPTGTLSITENSGNTANDGTICSGANVTFTAPAGFVGYNFLLNGISVQNGSSRTFTKSNLSDQDKVEVAISNSNNCIALLPGITVTVNPLPSVAPITGTLTLCAGSTTTLSNITAGGVWSSLNTAVATIDASGVVTGVSGGAAIITYTVTNASGCDSVVKATVTVNALPIVAAITGAASVCEGSSITLGDLTSGGTWSSSDELVATIDASGTLNGIQAGTVTITYTVANGGCTNATTKVITVNALPVLSAITGNLALCVNTTSTLSSSPSGGAWTSNNKPVATVNAATGVVTAVSAGTAVITYKVTTGSGCFASVSTTVTVNPLPVPTLTGKNPICLNDNEKYVTEAGQTAYVWNVVGGTITGGGTSIDDTIQVTWTASGTKSITVNYTNSFGCTAATSSTFTNAPTTAPPSFVSGVSAACLNTSGNVYSTQAGHTDYTWTVTGGTIEAGGTDTDDAITITWNSTGNKSVSVNYSDAFGCNAVSATVYPVTVNPLPTATVTGTATVCQGSASPEIIFKGAHGTSPYTFTYTVNGGAQQTIVSTDDFATIPVSTATPATFIYDLVSVKDASSTNCSQPQSGTATVIVSTTPSATIAYPAAAFCTSSAAVNVNQTGTPGGVYSSTTGLVIDATTGTITPATSAGGTYLITYTVAAAGGCSSYATTTSVTITTAPTASISYTGGPFCTSSAPVAVSVTGTSGGIYSSSTGLTINSSTGTITPASSTNGTYTVTYSIAASGGCAAFSTTTSVTITTAPTATIAYAGSPLCTSVAAVAVTRTGAAGGTYSAASGLSINTTTGAITPGTSTGGTYTVTYSIGGTGGCANFTTTTSVTITAAPTAVAGTAIPTCANGGAVNITTGSSATNQSSIAWTSNGTGTIANPASLTTATFTPSPADIAAGSRILTLTAYGSAGCANATSTKTITISAVPATFNITPGDTAICLGNVIPMSTSIGSPVTTSNTFSSSATLNLTIPNPGNTSNTIAVSGIPAGAIINSVSVNFNSNHNNDGDLIVNIKAPNLKVLNLINHKGGSGDGFNANISSASVTSISGNGPINGTFAADAANNTGAPSSSNTTRYSDLFSTPNGNWVLGVQDDDGFGTGSGRINSWSVTINYTTLPTPVNVVWTPTTYLYTDALLTTAYTGQSQATVYTKPAATGTIVYTATSSNGAGCSTTKTVSITTNAIPVVSIAADYCIVPGKVRLTATATPAATSYLWSNGATTQFIDVDIAGSFDVTAFGATSCPGKATINVANELVTNGDFSSGNTAFTSDYAYKADLPGLVPAGQGELYDDSGINGYSISTNGQNVHTSFYGQDHTANTSGTRNFMVVNGHGNTLVVWKQTVNVQPNTTYYFSAWAMSMNSGGNNAQLRFSVNGSPVGTTAILSNHVESTTATDNWTRFYGTWTSGPTTTSADIYINDLQSALGGNDFGLDDVSFGTLSTFITLESAVGTDAQTVCKGTPITNILYSVGNGSTTGPTVTGLPVGVISTYNGDLTISGTPTDPGGTYTYTITTTGTCNPTSVSGTITVQAPTISLSDGSSSPSACANSPLSIGFTIGGTATGASVTGLPAGVTGTLSGTTYTISGTPTVVGAYNYTITTTGTCSPQTTISGTITVQGQTITLNTIPATAAQTVCINSPITTIRYAVGGTANNASVSGLPAGVTGVYSGGFINITGSPSTSAGSPYTFTVTSSGPSCSPVSITGTLAVTPAASLTLTSATGTNAQNACNNLPITSITYSVNNATGASITSGALPAGVTGTYSAGVFTISGTPTAGGVFNYTITTSGGCASGTATGSISVQAQTISLTSGQASPSLCGNTAMPAIAYTIGGTATGATVTGLPNGVTGSLSGNVFTINGTPTDPAGPYNYTVTTSGSCDPKTATGTITIQPGATGGSLTSLFACSSTSGSITLSGQAGTIQRWESSTDNGTTWSSITNTTITQTYTNIAVPTMYRAVVGNGCGAVTSSVATIGLHNYWTGTVSTNWNNVANWSDGAMPTTSCPDVTIPAGTPFSPILSAGTASIVNLIIKPTASLTITGATLQIAGTVTSSGGLIATNGSVVFNGTAAQVISGDVFTGNTLMNLTLSNAAGLTAAGGAGKSLNVTGVLNFGSVNNAILHTGDNITLASTAAGTARVADVTNNGANTGNHFDGIVTVQRYFPARRAWRLFTAPVSAGGSIFDNWQNGGVYQAGKGTYVSGATATSPTGANGLDWSPLNNSSLKATVNLGPVINTHSSGLSRNIADTSDNIPYFIFVRGDRDPANTNIANSNNTTLNSRGKLQIGRQTFPANTTALGYTIIGNPYASPVDFAKILRTNVVNRFWVWDPYLNAEQGAWVTFDDPTNSGTYSHTETIGLTAQLQSGQAFFVMTATNGPASVTFGETAKSSSTNQSAFRPIAKAPALRINLHHLNEGNKTVLLDGILAQFDDQFSRGVDLLDADKAGNVKEMLSFRTDSKLLSIERRPVPVAEDTLHLQLTKTTQRHYRFQFEPANLDTTVAAFLDDKYTGIKTPLSLTSNSVYDFTINGEPASALTDRFNIVFKQIVPPSVMHNTIKAYQLATNIAVEWTTENEINIGSYEVEKSADGQNFVNVNTVVAKGTDHTTTTYSWLDATPFPGDNFYRIRRISQDGSAQYGDQVMVKMGKVTSGIRIYPNPVTNGVIGAEFKNMPAGIYSAKLLNNLGQAVLNKTLNHATGTSMEYIQPDYKLAPGIYQLEITSPDKVTTKVKVIMK